MLKQRFKLKIQHLKTFNTSLTTILRVNSEVKAKRGQNLLGEASAK
jgi:hypothetical protein